MKNFLLSILFVVFLAVFKTNAQESFEITFTHEGKTVYGTFSRPDSTGQFPVIVINPGSGAMDRDGTLPMIGPNVSCLYPELLYDTLRIYKQMAYDFVEAGFAVLRYDKLEYTYSSPGSLGPISFKKLWLPVMSAIDYVKTRPDVDTTSIFLLGHSEGGSLIPYIARSRNDIRGLVSVAASRTPLDSLLAHQLVYFAEICNGDVEMAQVQANQVLHYFSLVRSGEWGSSTPPLFGVQPAVWYDYITAVDSVAINYNLAGLPALFLGLELDVNVPLSELNRFMEEVAITDDFWVMPGLNHYMTTNDHPIVSKMLTDTIIHWLNQFLLPTAMPYSKIDKLHLNVYPNPIKNTFTLSLKGLKSGNINVFVKNLLGEILLSDVIWLTDDILQLNYSLEGLVSGIYFVKVIVENHIITKKIIKN